jgi:hypothetical protein
MKAIHKRLVLLFFSVLGLTSCTDNLIETDKGNQTLELSVNNDMVVLDINVPESNALAFSWTPGSNFNTNAAISYTLEIAMSGTSFEPSRTEVFEKGVTFFSLKTEEVNALLLESFGVNPNEEAELEARITATVHNDQITPQVSGIVKMRITGYQPVSKTLYLIGDAAPNGWDADNATKMNSISGVAGGFVWQGRLNAGNLKFITTLGSFVPSYNKGGDDTKLYLRESFDDAYDEPFNIPTGGVYKITLNIINLAIKIEALEAPEYSQLWFVGNPTSWNFRAMTVDAADPFIFHYNADLSAGGEFKIATIEGNWDCVFFRPTVDLTAEGVNLDVGKWAGDPDYKWNITGGVYKIKLDTRDMKIDIVPFTPYAMIYLVGDASPNGWEIGNATSMNAGSDMNKFTWTGTLNVGELKFTCDRQTDWNGAFFLASQNGIEPTGSEEPMIFSSSGSNPDNKWKINDAGTYSIELDQLQETVIIIKQ